MFDEILQKIRGKITSLQYVMTLHAEEEMNDDNLTIYDIEQSIQNGEMNVKKIELRLNQNTALEE